jgi:hypothetical protein
MALASRAYSCCLFCRALTKLTAASPPSSTDCVLSTGRFLTKLLESDFEAKYADEINKKAEDAKKWVQKGMKDDAAKK